MRWRLDETYIKVNGQWKYFYRAVDKAGNTIDFFLTADREKKDALRFLTKAIDRNGKPGLINIDKSGANMAAGGFHNSGLRISFRNKRICHIFQHIPSPCFPIAAQHEYSLCVFFAPKYTRSFEA